MGELLYGWFNYFSVVLGLRVVLRVRRKGVLILPKRVREEAGISEGDEVVVEVEEGRLVLRVLKPKVVDVDPGLVEKFLREEFELEKKRYGGIIHG